MEEKGNRYTYADYATWDDSVRYELIDGIPYMMTAPKWEHQSISAALTKQFGIFLEGHSCMVFAAPFDVRLNADTEDNTVVQPGLVILCDRTRLSGSGCTGAPDMVVEIVSPSSARHDRLIKFQQYLKAGITEYWIIDPESKTVSVFILENGKYTISAYSDTDMIPVHVLKGCEINMEDVFKDIPDDAESSQVKTGPGV
jgi:Uma2 family endonuclease